MVQLQKFLFDNFVIKENDCVEQTQDLPEDNQPEIVAEQEPIEPVVEIADIVTFSEEITSYSQQEFDKAVSEAKEQGWSQGYNQAQQEHDEISEKLLENISNNMQELISQGDSLAQIYEQRNKDICMAIIQKVVPGLLEDHAQQIVSDFLEKNFSNIIKEDRLCFCLHPQIVSKIAPKIENLAKSHGYTGKISIKKDENLMISDCKILWDKGSAEKNTAGIITEIKNIISGRKNING